METIPKKKLQKLTKKQRGFVNDYVESENGTQAVLKNYNVKDSMVAASVATENLRKPYITEAIEVKRKSLKQALIDKGITEDYLADKVNILLQATDKEGKPDTNAVDKGLKHATNIYGVEDASEKPKTNIYNFFTNPTFQQNIKNYDENFKNEFIKSQQDVE
jgi:phage terminase small subunit